jgi:hypothetical protein
MHLELDWTAADLFDLLVSLWGNMMATAVLASPSYWVGPKSSGFFIPGLLFFLFDSRPDL